VRDGLSDGVQSGQGSVYLHQAAHSKGTEVDGREPEAVDDRAEQFFGVLVVAGEKKIRGAAPGHAQLVQELVVEPLSPVQLQQLGEAAATVVQAIDTANRARKLSDAQSPDSTEECPT
jgi:hypothetical protein